MQIQTSDSIRSLIESQSSIEENILGRLISRIFHFTNYLLFLKCFVFSPRTFSSDEEQEESGSAWCEKHCPGWRRSNPFSYIRHYVSKLLTRRQSQTLWRHAVCTLLTHLLCTNTVKWQRVKGPLFLLTAMPTWCPMIWPELPSSK